MIVAGDNGTDTWEWPCQTYDWELMARDSGEGDWDIFIAPSLPQNIYNVFFFYDDNTLALGMVSVR